MLQTRQKQSQPCEPVSFGLLTVLQIAVLFSNQQHFVCTVHSNSICVVVVVRSVALDTKMVSLHGTGRVVAIMQSGMHICCSYCSTIRTVGNNSSCALLYLMFNGLNNYVASGKYVLNAIG